LNDYNTKSFLYSFSNAFLEPSFFIHFFYRSTFFIKKHFGFSFFFLFIKNLFYQFLFLSIFCFY